jgi:integrase
MAIQAYCPTCKAYGPANSKKCQKCASVFPREGRRFRVDVSLKGRRLTRFTPNLTLARELESSLRADLLRDEFDISAHRVKSIPKLDDVWTRFLEWGKEHKKTWKIDEYNYSTHLQPRFGSKTLDTITSFDVERLKIEMKRATSKQGRPYTQATIKHQLVLMKRLYNLAQRWGMYSGDNPMTRVDIPRLDNQKTEILSDEETESLLNVLDTWPCRDTVAFIRFAMLSGMRRGELFRLKWEDIDFEHGIVRIVAPKGGKTMNVPVSSRALDVLRALPITATFVFPGKNGEQRTDFKGPWQRIRKAAGLPDDFRFHGLRHNFASQLVSKGVDLAVIRELLTHKDTRTTARYSHLRPDAVKEAARKSADIIMGAKKAVVIELKQ